MHDVGAGALLELLHAEVRVGAVLRQRVPLVALDRLGLAAAQNLGDARPADRRLRDPDNGEEKNFVTEPFCSILSEVSLGSTDPEEFLRAAVPFANDRVWGTLNAMLVVHPKVEKSSAEICSCSGAAGSPLFGSTCLSTVSNSADMSSPHFSPGAPSVSDDQPLMPEA